LCGTTGTMLYVVIVYTTLLMQLDYSVS
jgi:hypothetical protein